eukprot:m.334760 g.334760  ORF g.334760 m.334760 type:complete len:477 (+) comp20514_c0_seq3:151-1581(+)
MPPADMSGMVDKGTSHAHAAVVNDDDDDDDALHKAMKRMNKAKRKGRPELKPEDWYKHGYASKPEIWRNIDFDDTMTRIDYHKVTKEEFIERFEKPGRPVIIQGAFDGCKAKHRWTLAKLNKRFGDTKFKVGEDDDGYKVMVKLKHFLRYIDNQSDDSPLYAFDSSFGDHPEKKDLCNDYEVPKYFQDDLFRLCGEKRRPPYRWFLIGPPRSGTGIHIDPLGTSAWNASVMGRKRWVIFPPSTPKEAVRVGKGYDSEAITWFSRKLPQTRSSEWQHHKPIEFVQHEGDVVFIPGGWHHTVMNLDVTIAVTQNFCSPTNFRLVWPRTVRGRPKLSKKLYTQLQEHYPKLSALADTIDTKARDELPSDSSSDSSSSSSSSSSSEDEAEDKHPRANNSADNKEKHKHGDTKNEVREKSPKKKKSKEQCKLEAAKRTEKYNGSRRESGDGRHSAASESTPLFDRGSSSSKHQDKKRKVIS